MSFCVRPTPLLVGTPIDPLEEFLQSNSEVLTMVDPSIVVETAWFEYMIDSGCGDLLQGLVLEALPTKEATKEAGQVLLDIEKVKAGAVYGFVGTEVQSMVNIVHEWIRAVSTQRQPSFKAVKPGSFLERARNRMEWLVVAEEPASESTGGAAVVHKGKAAIDYLMRQVQADLAQHQAIICQS